MQLHPVSCLLILAVGLLIHPTTAVAQTPAPVAPATASVSGRVSHAATGQYLNNARVAVQGTNLVAFTDESGTYRLDRVAAGTVVLEVFYTGLEPQAVSLALVPSAAMEKDIALAAPPRARATGEAVKL
ncbi:MAG: carboxypeptidase-like regulatory domain-containing protein, partial [Verrucomicrobia bacterium]|nr:carboxypeptidase-like regulatory domain-containing protein [Verrucomicrobiota bacterium]